MTAEQLPNPERPASPEQAKAVLTELDRITGNLFPQLLNHQGERHKTGVSRDMTVARYEFGIKHSVMYDAMVLGSLSYEAGSTIVTYFVELDPAYQLLFSRHVRDPTFDAQPQPSFELMHSEELTLAPIERRRAEASVLFKEFSDVSFDRAMGLHIATSGEAEDIIEQLIQYPLAVTP